MIYELRVYRKKRVVAACFEAAGRPADIRSEAARLLGWYRARRVTIRKPGGGYLPPVLRMAPAAPESLSDGATDPDPTLTPSSDPRAAARV